MSKHKRSKQHHGHRSKLRKADAKGTVSRNIKVPLELIHRFNEKYGKGVRFCDFVVGLIERDLA